MPASASDSVSSEKKVTLWYFAGMFAPPSKLTLLAKERRPSVSSTNDVPKGKLQVRYSEHNPSGGGGGVWG